MNVRVDTKEAFSRAITSDDVVFVTDLEIDGDSNRDEPAGIGLIDENGNPIAGTAVLFDIGQGGNNLLDFDAVFSQNGSVGQYNLFGSVMTLANFNGYSGTDAYGVYFSSSRDADVSIVGLATIPEPASLALMATGGAMLLSWRRR